MVKNVFLNLSLVLVLGLLAYLPFSVYSFEQVETKSSNVLSATSSQGKFVEFKNHSQKVAALEAVSFSLFDLQSVMYKNFYSVKNETSEVLEYEVSVIESNNYQTNVFFTDNELQRIMVLPGESAGLTASFKSSPSTNKANLTFIIISK